MIRVKREIHETYVVPLKVLKRRLGICRPWQNVTIEIGKDVDSAREVDASCGYTADGRDNVVRLHVRFTERERRPNR